MLATWSYVPPCMPASALLDRLLLLPAPLLLQAVALVFDHAALPTATTMVTTLAPPPPAAHGHAAPHARGGVAIQRNDSMRQVRIESPGWAPCAW